MPSTTSPAYFVPATGMTYIAITDAGIFRVKVMRHCAQSPAAIVKVEGTSRFVQVDYCDLQPAR